MKLFHYKNCCSFLGGNRAQLESSGIVVDNNEIFDFSRVAAVGNDAITPRGVGHIIRHNTIYNGQYCAVRYQVNTYIRHCPYIKFIWIKRWFIHITIWIKYSFLVKRLYLATCNENWQQLLCEELHEVWSGFRETTWSWSITTFTTTAWTQRTAEPSKQGLEHG